MYLTRISSFYNPLSSGGGLFELCNYQEQSVRISSECISMEYLCIDWSMESIFNKMELKIYAADEDINGMPKLLTRDIFFDPRHISICKNLTFWLNKKQFVDHSLKRHNKTNDELRLWWLQFVFNYFNKKFKFRCNGNFPGMKTSKNESGECGSDLVYSECPDYSDCRISVINGTCPRETNVMTFLCHDGKFCIHEGLQCDGYSQCIDGSGNRKL